MVALLKRPGLNPPNNSGIIGGVVTNPANAYDLNSATFATIGGTNVAFSTVDFEITPVESIVGLVLIGVWIDWTLTIDTTGGQFVRLVLRNFLNSVPIDKTVSAARAAEFYMATSPYVNLDLVKPRVTISAEASGAPGKTVKADVYELRFVIAQRGMMTEQDG